MATTLQARRVTKEYDAGGTLFRRKVNVALESFSLSINSDHPSITAIAGESGSGKTTFARLLLGIIRATRGEVLYNGRNLEDMSREEWKEFRRQVQAIFQDPFEVFNPFYKVDHVLTTPVAKFHLAKSGSEAKGLIERALEGVGLRPEETLGRYPHQLSGGQRQRIMIARTLLLDPSIIVADEPVSMIDASLRATILESLLKLNRELGISLVYITHDLATAYQLAQNIVILYRGISVEVGDVAKVIKNAQHPYTRLLVNSIPLPNPDLRWQKEERPETTESTPAAGAGCKFADRCPEVMPVCREAMPPLYRTDETRAVACYLYEGSPVTESPAVMGSQEAK